MCASCIRLASLLIVDLWNFLLLPGGSGGEESWGAPQTHGVTPRSSREAKDLCLHAAVLDSPNTGPVKSKPPPDLTLVPTEYYDLGQVFRKDQALSLPPHRPYDSGIDLLLRAPLPTIRLFSLSKPECDTMERYVTDSLAAGIIRPSSSPLEAGFFFVEKKNKTLCPCIDFRGLNK